MSINALFSKHISVFAGQVGTGVAGARGGVDALAFTGRPGYHRGSP